MTNNPRPLLEKLKDVTSEVEAAWQRAEDLLPEVGDDQREGLLKLLSDLDILQRRAEVLRAILQEMAMMSDRQYDEYFSKVEEIRRVFRVKAEELLGH